MEKFAVYYETGIHAFNIFDLDNDGLQKVVDAYQYGEKIFYIFGTTYRFSNVEKIRIFQFANPDSSKGFESWARDNGLFKLRSGGRLVVPLDVVETIGPDVTAIYITDGYGTKVRDQIRKTRIMDDGNRVQSMDIFVSHSSKDKDIASALIRLIEKALKLSATQIRCTSVDGYRLPGGAKIDETITKEIHESRIFIALLTTQSMQSTYVLFEMGARWAIGGYLVPIICQPDGQSLVKGPLQSLNVLDGTREPELHQLINDICKFLAVSSEPTASYLAELKAFAAICADNISAKETRSIETEQVKEEKKDDFSELKILSDKAKMILKKTSESERGDIRFVNTKDSYQVICGQTAIRFQSHRELIYWESAVNELLQYLLIDRINMGTLLAYQLTEKGYWLADEIVLDTAAET